MKSEDKKPTTPEDEEHPHYEWGASAAKQWRSCKGSINFVRALREAGKLSPKDSTQYSEEGTEAHAWADKCLKKEIELMDIPEEFREHLEGYIEVATELVDTAAADVAIFHETLVPLFYAPDHSGTVDFCVFSSNGLDVLDLKYGEGVEVDADENDQLIIYGVSVLFKLSGEGKIDLKDPEIEKLPVRLIIYQPRHRSFDGLPSVFTTTVRELLDYIPDIFRDYNESLEASPDDLTPSVGACQFCPARKGKCKVRIANLFEDIPDELNPLIGDPTPEEMAKRIPEIDNLVRLRVVEKGKAIAKFFDDLNEDTLAMVESGKPVPGVKSVDGGLGIRRWNDEKGAATLLGKIPSEKRYKPKTVISPTQAVRVLKELKIPLDAQSKRFQTRFNQLISRKQGGPKLVLASDKRTARIPVVEQFDDVQDEEKEIDMDDCF